MAEAIRFFEEQWKGCLRSIPDCDVVAAAKRTRGAVNDESARTATAFNANGYTAENVDALEYRVDAVMISPDGQTAVATVCVTDPVRISEADGTPVDHQYVTSIQEYGLSMRDGEWQWVTRVQIGEPGESEEDDLCA